MKLTITALVLFIGSFTYGQTYKSIIAEADGFYNSKEYQKSVDKFKEAFKMEQKSAGDFYNAGCAASLLGDKELAFEWLNLALKNGWTNIAHLKTDSDLLSLHDSKKWNDLLTEMQKEADKKEANYDKSLQTKLLAIYNDDQPIRQQYISAQKEFGNQSKQVDSLGKVMMYKDSINLIKVTEILDKYGWVGADKVGEQANQTLFLVIQHSDLKTQQKYLPMMREAVKNKKANASALALLEDRVALGEGKRQMYGSQIGWDIETNKNYVLPLADPDNVDKRRAEAGLGPLADYVKRWDIIWNAEEYKKQLSGQNTNDKTPCSILKQGSFKYLDIPDTTAYFDLDKENHTEYHRNGKYVIKSKIKWINDCQYEMKMLSNTIPDFPFKPGDVMIVTIDKVEGNIIYYTSEVKDDKWTGRLIRLR